MRREGEKMRIKRSEEIGVKNEYGL